MNDTSTGDFLSELKNRKRLTIAQKIQLAQLELDAERLEIDKIKSRTEQRFWNKNFAATIAAIVSFAAVLISFAQVWSSNIQKEKELAIKDKELELAQIKSHQDFNAFNTQLTEQQKSEALKFMSSFKEVFLVGNKTKMGAIEDIIRKNYPTMDIEGFFSRFEITTTSSQTVEKTREIRALIIPKVRKNIKTINKSSQKSSETTKIPANMYVIFDKIANNIR